ncbi:PAS domain S-box protein [Lyngbya sp. CCAP 1446/10]|uniref:PAS domain-containing sensor histidine kinase n=1 Tax=Lyngbya sp. CCAP 1446/10 TaxID=439293 RepID=UPI002238ADBF|nr:PAS domain S-box protein [Lyngbya sp. CCAP 1446/10]MCW6049065.1 PAS domain S-box protein [Lyngbya sp. CCAP 1446/10]
MIWNLLNNLLFTGNYIPHGHCYLWQRELVALHIVSDSIIALAYYSIPLSLIYFITQGKDLPFRNIFWLFAAFIISCGTTHIMEVWTLWHPVYWVSGSLKIITAAISAYTAFALIPLVPQALTLISPTQLGMIDRILQQEIIERRKTEARYHTLTEASPMGIFYTDALGDCLYVNERWCQISGMTCDEALGKGWLQGIHPDDRQRVCAEWYSAAQQKLPFTSEYRFQGIDRTKISWVLGQAVGKIGENGEVNYVGTITDITERKQVEEENRLLNETLENRVAERIAKMEISHHNLPEEIAYRERIAITLLELTQLQNAILNSTHYTIISTDPDGTIKTFNRAAQQLLGYSPEEVVGKVTPAIIHDPLEVDKRAEVLSQQLGVKIEPGMEVFVALPRRGIADQNEWTYIRKDGSRFPVQLSVTALFDPEGNITGFLAIGQDISDRKQAEKELRDLTAAMQNAVEGISRVDIEGRYVNVNRAYAHRCGYKPEEMIGMEWQLTVHPGDVEMLLCAYQEMLTSGKVEVEARGVRKNGSFFYKQVTMVKAWDAQGIFNGNHCFMKDITERKLTETALQESEFKYRQIVELAEEGIWVIDGNALTTYVNHAMARMLGYSELEMFGRPLLDFMDEQEKQQALDHVERHKQGIGEQHEFKFKSKDGKDIWTDMSTSPVMDSQGNLLSCCALVYNITHRKAAEQQMLQLTEDLKRSNEELEQFAYVASHDLQEPLRAVTSYAQLLAQRYQGNLDAKADKYIHYIVDGATRMQQLINDLLAYSRLGTRCKEFELADCNAAVNQSLSNLQIAIAETKAVITCDAMPTVMADEFQLVQLFQNLISNGIKFCREDIPLIQIAAQRQEGEWLLSVRDNGIGIDPEYADRIFIIFQRLHSRREYSGTGIGLAMCKRIVERHGGRIWVESQEEKGAIFYFTIPIISI